MKKNIYINEFYSPTDFILSDDVLEKILRLDE